eukprot:TRINITY_DN30258_c0_g1_i3.p1 TRINITY_DN30258_c0_g1~~TRINITY_DN30258_c0_g1_i3.p1  ORF type:complete len:208 (+),score=62.18 TRINITY_DN30258_c0_g1_i3:27-650(+)
MCELSGAILLEAVSSLISPVFFFFFKQKTAYEMLRSLVGSEMCIRDRGTPVWIRISEVEWRRAMVVCPLSAGRWSVRGDESRTSRNKFEVFEEDMCFRSENEHELMANNLSALQDVTVPQVVNALIQRYSRGRFATWGGDALVMVVPQKPQPALTPNDHQKFKAWNESMPPHILAMGANCLLYTSDAADEEDSVDLGGRRSIKKKKT